MGKNYLCFPFTARFVFSPLLPLCSLDYADIKGPIVDAVVWYDGGSMEGCTRHTESLGWARSW